jgi:hypothetical protein
MKSAPLAKLCRLFGLVRMAEETHLARAMAEIAACHDRATRFRLDGRDAGLAAMSIRDAPAAADLVAVSRWVRRLDQRADDEGARAAALDVEVAVIRDRLARAFGRESVAAELLARAVDEERKLTARRAENASIVRRTAP